MSTSEAWREREEREVQLFTLMLLLVRIQLFSFSIYMYMIDTMPLYFIFSPGFCSFVFLAAHLRSEDVNQGGQGTRLAAPYQPLMQPAARYITYVINSALYNGPHPFLHSRLFLYSPGLQSHSVSLLTTFPSQCSHITHSDTFWKVCCCWGSKWHATQSMQGKRMNWIELICRLTVLGMFLKCRLFVVKTQQNTPPPAAVCFYIYSEWKCFGHFVHHFMLQLPRNSTWLCFVLGESLILAKCSALLDNEIKGAFPQSLGARRYSWVTFKMQGMNMPQS